jgi:DNA-binding transcriptional LysR family regulator
MELRQLEYVIAAVDEGGFTRAAARLHVAQPSLSQGVRTLEAELGTPLFDRLGRHVVLTAAGEAFVGPARQTLRDAATARASVAAVRGLVAGHLDIVALPTLVVEPLARLVGAFREAFPQIVVRVAEPEDADAVVSMIATARCEIGLSEEPRREHDLVFQPLMTQEVLAVMPPGTKPTRGPSLPVSALAGMPLITTPIGTSTRRLVDQALASANIEPSIAVETSQREAILPLVLAGAGTSFLPSPLALEASRQGAVVKSLSPPLVRKIGLLQRRGPLSPAALGFVRLTSRAPATSESSTGRPTNGPTRAPKA